MSADLFASLVDQIADRVVVKLQHELAPAVPPPEVLDVPEACALLRVSRAKLHRLIKAKVVRVHYLGESPRFLRSELLDDVRANVDRRAKR